MYTETIINIANFLDTSLVSIKGGDLLTFVALLLAVFAYRKSVLDKYESWKALLQSFLDELKEQSPWIGGVYVHSQEKDWFAPNKIVYKLSFESALEITRKGISDSKIISTELYGKISLFNERVEAFNQQLEYQKSTISANPVLSGKLQDFLDKNGLKRQNCLFPQFSKEVANLQNSKNKGEQEMYHLATRLYLINDVIHNQLIGNYGRSDSLNSLYNTIHKELFEKLEVYDQSLPPYFRKNYFYFLVLLSTLLFLFIEKYFL